MDINKFSEYDQKYLSENARKAIVGYRQQALDGEMSWKDANHLAELWRIEAGYQAGPDGTGYYPVDKKIHTIPRVEEDKTTFDYFKGTDQYKSMLDSYQRGGKLAMQDTVADVAARTGGLASSYAGAAGQQMYNQYMQGFDEVARTEYQQYLDRLLQEEQLKKADEETAYNRQQTEYNKLLTQAQILANYGDFSGFKALGYTDEQIANMQSVWENGGGSDTGKPVTSDVFKAVVDKAQSYDDLDAAAEYIDQCVSKGYISEDEALMIYTVYLGGVSKTPTTYEEFIEMGGPSTISTAADFYRLAAGQRFDTYEEYLADQWMRFNTV